MATKKTETVICDRCHEYDEYPSPAPAIRYNQWGKIEFTWSLGASTVRDYDLCEDCRRDFMDWIVMREVESDERLGEPEETE